MSLIKESKKIDLIIKSEPWSDKELKEFRAIMKVQKSRRKELTLRATKQKTKQNAQTPRLYNV